jgi:hypothetical protein
MFKKHIIEYQDNHYDRLIHNINFEDIAVGRKGTVLVSRGEANSARVLVSRGEANSARVLVDCKNDQIPIVRTTTNYNKPAQQFLPIHHDLMDRIKKVSDIKADPQIRDLQFNNAMIELYDSKYRSMGYHSDQALDLDNSSYICIFSCYNLPDTKDVRTLKIKNKTTDETIDIMMEHNSLIMFSVSTNSKYLHKIILEQCTDTKTCWLGITFRLSRTTISIIDGIPHITQTGEILKLADTDERKQFYKWRQAENNQIDFQYPPTNLTISKSDLMPIIQNVIID